MKFHLNITFCPGILVKDFDFKILKEKTIKNSTEKQAALSSYFPDTVLCQGLKFTSHNWHIMLICSSPSWVQPVILGKKCLYWHVRKKGQSLLIQDSPLIIHVFQSCLHTKHQHYYSYILINQVQKVERLGFSSFLLLTSRDYFFLNLCIFLFLYFLSILIYFLFLHILSSFLFSRFSYSMVGYNQLLDLVPMPILSPFLNSLGVLKLYYSGKCRVWPISGTA